MSNILVADRDPQFRTLYHFVLSGHHLFEADSVSQALALLANQPIDLVVTEWEFPDGTAESLLEGMPSGHPVPVVLVSLIQDLVPPLPDVVKQRLNKPFRLPDLRSTVTQLLQN
jgi:DNA-binding NtrC family response regulator